MTMLAVVFGGSGFLGSHVCDALSEAGHEVRIVDKVPSPYARTGQDMWVGDILDFALVQKAVQGADFVCNFAGVAHLEQAYAQPLQSAQVNVLGNVHILEACRLAQEKHPLQRYIFASSLYVHGDKGGAYRCSKQACEHYVQLYTQDYALPCTIVRYGSLYGPRADAHNALYRFISQALQGESITYYGAATAQREYIHVIDAARLTVELVEKAVVGQPYILSGAQSFRVQDIFCMLEEMLGKPITVAYDTHTKHGHYQHSPYTFAPPITQKLFPNPAMDLGQGIVHMMQEIQGHLDKHKGLEI